MKYARFLVVGVAGMMASAGAMALGGCGSNSSSSGGNDSGAQDSTTGGETGPTGPMCSPVTGMNCPAAMGLTCCIDPTNIAGLLSGAPCVPSAQCTTTLQYACLQSSDCMSGQVCCAAVMGDAGILEGGLGDGGVPEGGIGSLLEGGTGGIMGLLGAINVHVSCETSCSAMQMQLCGSTAECKTTGDTCQATALPGAGALGGGDGGGAGGLTSMFPMAIKPKACTPPATEGGAPESGSPSDAGDGGTTPPSDAGDGGTTPADGASDAPTG